MRLSYCRLIASQLRDLAIFTIVLILLGLFVASLTGCTTHPVDPTTGVATTQHVDAADVVEQGAKVAESVAPSFGPWGIAGAAVIGALAPLIVGALRKKKQAQ